MNVYINIFHIQITSGLEQGKGVGRRKQRKEWRAKAKPKMKNPEKARSMRGR